MTAATWAAALLTGAGTVVVVAASLGALLARDVRDRLHFLSPVTSLGGPLIGLGVALHTGWHLATAEVLATVVLLAVSGPALTAAVGRVSTQRDGHVSAETPE